jgi:hypothetical protein
VCCGWRTSAPNAAYVSPPPCLHVHDVSAMLYMYQMCPWRLNCSPVPVSVSIKAQSNAPTNPIPPTPIKQEGEKISKRKPDRDGRSAAPGSAATAPARQPPPSAQRRALSYMAVLPQYSSQCSPIQSPAPVRADRRQTTARGRQGQGQEDKAAANGNGRARDDGGALAGDQ